jgi:hypothetical protein
MLPAFAVTLQDDGGGGDVSSYQQVANLPTVDIHLL